MGLAAALLTQAYLLRKKLYSPCLEFSLSAVVSEYHVSQVFNYNSALFTTVLILTPLFYTVCSSVEYCFSQFVVEPFMFFNLLALCVIVQVNFISSAFNASLVPALCCDVAGI